MGKMPPAAVILEKLSPEARRYLVSALDHGDEWGYRCEGYSPDSVLLSYEGRYWKWGDIASAGFLTPLGASVARLARDGDKTRKRSSEL